jgi:hypothetical protein
MSARSFMPIVLVLVLHAQSSRAVANEPDGESQRSQSDEPTLANGGSSGDAEMLFAEAKQLHDAHDLRGALQKLEQCYAVSRSANVLFNIASVHQELDDCPKALEFYRRYLAEATDDDGRSNANEQISALSQQCPAAEPAPVSPEAESKSPTIAPESVSEPAPAPRAPVPSQQPHRWLTAGGIALGAGALAGAATAFFSVRAFQAKHDYETTHSTQIYGERSADYNRDVVYSSICGAATGAAILFGVYALAVAAPRERTAPAALMVTIAPGRAQLGYRLSF